MRWTQAASRGVLQGAREAWNRGAIRAEEGKTKIHRNLLPETQVCNLETRRDLIFFYTSFSLKVEQKNQQDWQML